MRITILRLRLLKRLFGIEAVNADLLARTQGARQVLGAFGAQVDPTARIHGPLTIHNADHDYSNLVVGRNVHIGRGVFLDLSGRITLHDEAVISMQTTLLTHSDAGERPAAARIERSVSDLHVGREAYVGARVVILSGCHVGAAAIIGAGAVVTRPVPRKVRVAGVPARELPATVRT